MTIPGVDGFPVAVYVDGRKMVIYGIRTDGLGRQHLNYYWRDGVGRCDECGEQFEGVGYDDHHRTPLVRCACCAPMPEDA